MMMKITTINELIIAKGFLNVEKNQFKILIKIPRGKNIKLINSKIFNFSKKLTILDRKFLIPLMHLF